MSLLPHPATGKLSPMLYSGSLWRQESFIFEVLDLATGVWTELQPASVGQPHLPKLIPFGSHHLARDGALLYYDSDNAGGRVHAFHRGRWAKTFAVLERGLYNSKERHVLVPREFICG